MKRETPRVCMIVQDRKVKGGIAAVTNGYRGSPLEKAFDITYVESYCDGSKAKKLLKALHGYASYLRVLSTRRPSLTHMHSSFGPSFYRSIPFVLLSNAFRVPLINHIHGSEFDRLYTDAPAWKKRLIRFVWGKCDRIVVLTEEWKEKLSVAVSPAKIRVIQNYGTLVLKREEGAPQHKRILFLGLFTELKGVADAVQVMRRVHEKVPDAVLYMAGDGALFEETKEKVTSFGLDGVIRLPGWVRGERKEKLLTGCDIFYLPSYTEALPMSVLEAFGYGLAVVSCDVGGIPHLITDGENGILTAPGDIAAQENALCALLTDDALRTRLTKNAAKRLENEFSFDTHIGKVTKLYRELL